MERSPFTCIISKSLPKLIINELQEWHRHKKRPPSCYTEWPLYLSLAKSYCLPIVIEWSWHSSPAPGVLQMQRITVLSFESEPYIIYLFKKFALQNYNFFLISQSTIAKTVFLFLISDGYACNFVNFLKQKSKHRKSLGRCFLSDSTCQSRLITCNLIHPGYSRFLNHIL